jgi:L-2-hydroxyglutarate oxidase LhgO
LQVDENVENSNNFLIPHFMELKMSENTIDITIVGAGIVGVTIAIELLKKGFEVIIIEKEVRWGRGISSRNSEVLHAGIYYPENSLKAILCRQGNILLREYCEKREIGISNSGKLIVGWEKSHLNRLEEIRVNALKNGVYLKFMNKDEVAELEPVLNVVGALFSPQSAVLDLSTLIHSLYRDFESLGGMGAMGVEVTSLEKTSTAWMVRGKESDGGVFELESKVVINSGGLYSDSIAKMAGVDLKREDLELNWCKGDYFSLVAEKAKLIKRPIYPLPDKNGLGIHFTPDINGQVKLGPDTYYIEKEENYSVNPEKIEYFFESVKPFFPPIEKSDIAPLMSGIRPKLQKPNGVFRDFHIEEDLPGLINLIGIESPGVTASIALARFVVSSFFSC